jgi:aminoglycoside 2'-N-acetyltransferase I
VRVVDVQTLHTSSLDAATLRAIRALLIEAIGDFDAHDWVHSLGGMHAVVWESGTVVAHASVVQRRLLHGGRALRTGYVEAVAVREDRRRRGYATAVMQRLNSVLRGAYELGGLSAAGEDAGRLYRSLGWMRWEGRTFVLGPTGLQRTPDDDPTTYVLPIRPELDLRGDLVCDWREGDVW